MGVFVFNCPHCGKQIGAQDEWEGKTSMCPHCQKPVVIRHEMPNMPPGVQPINGMPQTTMSAWGDYEAPPEVCPNAKNAMWFGLASVCCCHICGIVAVVLGILGLNEIKQSNGRLEGKAYAWIGIVLGGVQVIVMIANLIAAPRYAKEYRELFEKIIDSKYNPKQIEEIDEPSVQQLPEPKKKLNEDSEPTEDTQTEEKMKPQEKPKEKTEPLYDLPPVKKPKPEELI